MKRIVLIITFIILSVLVYAQQINFKIDFIQTSKNFNGSNAVKIFGKMVPLNIRNYKHYGNTDNEGKILEGFIMYGEFYKLGYRFNLSDLDLAILKDCGLNIKKK